MSDSTIEAREIEILKAFKIILEKESLNSKLTLSDDEYSHLTKLINDIKYIIKRRGKDEVSTSTINEYITENNVIALLLRLFKTQTRIIPTQAEHDAERQAKRRAEIEEAKQIVKEEEANRVATLREQAVDGLRKLREIKYQGSGKKSKKLPKKEILGKMRCIYKIPGDRKEYLKHKGKLITVKEYKELMKAKPKKKEAKPKKVKKTKSKK